VRSPACSIRSALSCRSCSSSTNLLCAVTGLLDGVGGGGLGGLLGLLDGLLDAISDLLGGPSL
jgi:hypothetical protein